MFIKQNLDEYLFLDFDSLFNMTGLVHNFAFDKNGILIKCNFFAQKIIKEFSGRNQDDVIIGLSIQEIFRNLDSDIIDALLYENHTVMETKTAKQFYNIIKINNTEVKMLVVKMPFFNKKGEVSGILGIGQYIDQLVLDENFTNHLSKREKESINLLINGKTIKQIAKKLNLSPRTVEHYIENIKQKLSCSTRFELISKVLKFKSTILDGSDGYAKWHPIDKKTE